MKPRDLLILLAVGVLAVVAVADAVRSGASPAEEEATRDADGTTVDEESPPRRGRERFARTRAPGSVLFLDGDSCRLRMAAAGSGDEFPLPSVDTACDLWAPPRGARIAYRVGPSQAESVPFRFLDLNRARAELGGGRALFGQISWSRDGQRAAWCESRSRGFDVELGRGFRRVAGCPRAYSAAGEPLLVDGPRVVTERGDVVARGTGKVSSASRGEDGSLALVVDGNRVERFVRGSLTHARTIRPSVAAARVSFSPDNCALLAVRSGRVALVDLGCFRGRDAVTTVSPDNCIDRASATKSECARYPSPRAFEGIAATWSPDGDWIAVAEADAIAFHRVVGRYAVVRWRAHPRALAWIG